MKLGNNDIILIIDMQNVYLPNQPWGCFSFNRSLQNIKKLIKSREKKNTHSRIFFTKFIHNPEATGTWAEYNIQNKEINNNAWMSEIVDELKGCASKYPVLSKSTYSSMGNKVLREEAKSASKIVITGVVSECCVLSTCFEAIDMGLHVVYLKDACSGINEENEQATARILESLSPVHVKIMTTDEYIKR